MQLELNVRPPMQAVDPSLISKQPTMTKALILCQTMSGLDDKSFLGEHGVVKDAAQWSRIMGSGQHNFPHDKLNLFMDKAGNEAPLLWLLNSRGYELSSLRKQETDTERRLRLAEEALHAERAKNRIMVDAMNGRVSA